MVMLKDDSNFKVYGWMLNKLKLKGNELLIYAIIYSFSQNNNGEGVFNASTKYLQEWTNSSKQSVIDCLNSLVKKKLIIKFEDNSKKRKPNVYKTIDKTGQESLLAQVNKVDKTGQESLPNNNIINTNHNTNYKNNNNRYISFYANAKRITDFYTNNVAVILSLNAQYIIGEYIELYGEDKTFKAIKKAFASKPNMKDIALIKYAGGILRTWQQYGDETPKPVSSGKSAAFDSLKQFLED